jgi:hypothetical protein
VSVKYRSHPKGVFQTYSKGSYFGEFALLGIPAYFDYVAKSSVVCLIIPYSQELKIMLEPKLKKLAEQIISNLQDLLSMKYYHKSELRRTQPKAIKSKSYLFTKKSPTLGTVQNQFYKMSRSLYSGTLDPGAHSNNYKVEPSHQNQKYGGFQLVEDRVFGTKLEMEIPDEDIHIEFNKQPPISNTRTEGSSMMRFPGDFADLYLRSHPKTIESPPSPKPNQVPRLALSKLSPQGLPVAKIPVKSQKESLVGSRAQSLVNSDRTISIGHDLDESFEVYHPDHLDERQYENAAFHDSRSGFQLMFKQTLANQKLELNRESERSLNPLSQDEQASALNSEDKQEFELNHNWEVWLSLQEQDKSSKVPPTQAVKFIEVVLQLISAKI